MLSPENSNNNSLTFIFKYPSKCLFMLKMSCEHIQADPYVHTLHIFYVCLYLYFSASLRMWTRQSSTTRNCGRRCCWKFKPDDLKT